MAWPEADEQLYQLLWTLGEYDQVAVVDFP
jgi:hypothetical protein